MRPNSLLAATSLATRSFAYTAETKPFVFINEHTKVICQGMTGKHVSIHIKVELKNAEKRGNSRQILAYNFDDSLFAVLHYHTNFSFVS